MKPSRNQSDCQFEICFKITEETFSENINTYKKEKKMAPFLSLIFSELGSLVIKC